MAARSHKAKQGKPKKKEIYKHTITYNQEVNKKESPSEGAQKRKSKKKM